MDRVSYYYFNSQWLEHFDTETREARYCNLSGEPIAWAQLVLEY